jgi:hypothetical protein
VIIQDGSRNFPENTALFQEIIICLCDYTVDGTGGSIEEVSKGGSLQMALDFLSYK